MGDSQVNFASRHFSVRDAAARLNRTVRPISRVLSQPRQRSWDQAQRTAALPGLTVPSAMHAQLDPAERTASTSRVLRKCCALTALATVATCVARGAGTRGGYAIDARLRYSSDYYVLSAYKSLTADEVHASCKTLGRWRGLVPGTPTSTNLPSTYR
eukprot:COSAG02_NODE_550_length_20437_cov_4.270676_7_plen_157_part_00